MELERKQVLEAPKSKRTFTDVVVDIFSFLFLPFKYFAKGLRIIQEDTNKIRAFKRWKEKAKQSSRRQKRYSDEF